MTKVSSRSLSITTIDQVVSSLSNFLFLILLAMIQNVEDFARSSTLWIVISYIVITQRSVFGIPLLLDLNSKDEFSQGNSGIKFASIVLSAPAATCALIFYVDTANIVYLYIACLVPIILLQDIGRYIAISRANAGTALASDLFLLAPVLSLVIFSFATDGKVSTTVTVAFFAFGLIGASALVLGHRIFVFSIRELSVLLSEDVSRRKRLFYDSILISGTALGTVLFVWVCYGSAGVAGLNGSLTALAPIGLSTLVIQLVIQHGIAASQGSVRMREKSLFLILLILGIAWVVIILGVPESVGQSLLGVTWGTARNLFIPMGFALLVGLLIEFLVVALRAQNSMKMVVKVRQLVIAFIPVSYLAASLFHLELRLAIYANGVWGLVVAIWIIVRFNPISDKKNLDTEIGVIK